jgi:hypothetical protein
MSRTLAPEAHYSSGDYDRHHRGEVDFRSRQSFIEQVEPMNAGLSLEDQAEAARLADRLEELWEKSRKVRGQAIMQAIFDKP